MEIRDIRNGKWYWVYDAVLADPHLTAAEKLIYSALATFSGCRDIYPNIKELGDRALVSERATQYAIKKLEKVGYITIERRPGKQNIYYLLKMPKGCKICTGAKNDTKGVQMTTERGANNDTLNNTINKTINNTIGDGLKNSFDGRRTGDEPADGYPEEQQKKNLTWLAEQRAGLLKKVEMADAQTRTQAQEQAAAEIRPSGKRKI